MDTFAKKAIDFHRNLRFTEKLPDGIKVLNPFADDKNVGRILEQFYSKFYSDTGQRKLILGINPGRLGAGATGIPFTDTKRLKEYCGIDGGHLKTHEPSSVFVYEVIKAYGSPEAFYRKFYIDSVCPLGFVRKNKKGNWVNCNYYDFPSLFSVTKSFIVDRLKAQIGIGVDTETCYVLGKKNAVFLDKINREENLFGKLIVFPHPRYIVQYKSREMEKYSADYLQELRK